MTSFKEQFDSSSYEKYDCTYRINHSLFRFLRLSVHAICLLGIFLSCIGFLLSFFFSSVRSYVMSRWYFSHGALDFSIECDIYIRLFFANKQEKSTSTSLNSHLHAPENNRHYKYPLFLTDWLSQAKHRKCHTLSVLIQIVRIVVLIIALLIIVVLLAIPVIIMIVVIILAMSKLVFFLLTHLVLVLVVFLMVWNVRNAIELIIVMISIAIIMAFLDAVNVITFIVINAALNNFLCKKTFFQLNNKILLVPGHIKRSTNFSHTMKIWCQAKVRNDGFKVDLFIRKGNGGKW